MDGVKTQDGLLRAYAEFVLAEPYQARSSGIIVVESNPSIRKATIVDVGADVPFLSPGDLIYFEDSIEVEPGILAIHVTHIVSFSRLVDDYA